MSPPTPITFEMSGKPPAAPRNATAAAGNRSFADAVQAQRDAERRARDDAAAEAAAAASRPDAGRAERSQTTEGRPHRDGTGAGQRDQAKGSAQTQSARPDRTDAKTAAKTTAVETADAERAAKGASQTAAKANSMSPNAVVSETRGTLSAQLQAAETTTSEKKSKAGTANTVKLNPHGEPAAGQNLKVVGRETALSTARPANAATAFAAQIAQRGQETGGSTEASARSSAAATEADTSSAARVSGRDPTAQALKEALSGQRKTDDGAPKEDTTDPRITRPEARSATTRGTGSMSPALRAAAEAVQQQLTGGPTNPGSTWSQNAGQNFAQNAGQGGPVAPRAEAIGSAPAAPAQSFDPVLQNAGPQPAGGGQTGSMSAAGNAASTAGTGAGNPAPTTPPAEQIAVQMQRAAAHGQSRVQIRLNPAELGRIDVKMEVSDDGHVRAVIAVDKPETLDLMQRDPRALERALQAAGLKTDQDSLNFSLRDDGTGKGQDGSNDSDERPGGVPGRIVGAPTGDQPIPTAPSHTDLAADGRIDIRV